MTTFSQAPATAAVPAGGDRPHSRTHIVAIDMIRLIIMAFVVGVHTLFFGGGAVTVTLGAVTTVFHTSRELFFLLTVLVLTYNYGHREHVSWLRFWRRRYWLIVPAYVTWSLIYFLADGSLHGSPASLLGRFWHDLLTAGARYHLYFLLVTMQVYLLFPALRWVLRKTSGHHVALFAAACAYQVALTAAIQHQLWRGGVLGGWLTGAGSGIWAESYVLYILGGAIVGWHFERICEVTRRYASAVSVTLAAGLGVGAGAGVYLLQVYAGGASPDAASAVFQPVVAVEALCLGWALLAGGLLWSDSGARGRTFFAAGSASSFGIYLGHPLVLQFVLWLAASSGFLAAMRAAPAALELMALLCLVMPVVYAGAWAIASAARRTPLSLVLTGREFSSRRRLSPSRGRAARLERGAVGLRRVVAGLGRAGARLWRVIVLRGQAALPVKLARLGVVIVVLAAGVFGSGYGLRILLRQSVTTTHSMQVGGMTRSWEQIMPTAPLPGNAPVIVVLSGISATLKMEIGRDYLLPYVKADMAELVYPAGYRESWNAIGCCGVASSRDVDDVAFLKALAARVDPGGRRQIDLVGYSNGGRLAYRMACDDPGVYDQIAVVKAAPMSGCVVTHPQDVLQVASLNDTAVPFQPGDKGKESPPATVQVARLRAADKCREPPVTTAHGRSMTLTVWAGCADGTRVGLAAYSTGGHDFPPPTSAEPAAAAVIWAFFHGTDTVAPVPA